MDRKTIFESYGKYYDAIQSLSSFSVLEVPTVDKVFNNRSLVQSVYRDMKEIGFPGTALDYLSWLSMAFLIDSIKKEIPKDATVLDWTLAIIENYEKHKADCRNLWRNWSYYIHFANLFESEIEGRLVDFKNKNEWEGVDTETAKLWMRSDAALGAFFELIGYEDATGKRRDDYDELAEFIRKLVTAKV
jgi:hypothetical protein